MTQRLKILCVRPRPNPANAAILNDAADEWVHALALHCDVETIERDFDLAEVHARVKPDLLVFDAIHWGRKYRLDIANIDKFPDLPKALLFNSDPHDPMRPLTMEMIAAYGIDTVFCTGHESLQQMNELRRFNCFVVPKYIDSAVFRDYAEDKVVPVTIMSAHLFPTFYPWRAQVTEEIQQVMPTLLYTHPGYSTATADPFAIRNEAYARMLSRSRFALADTTVLDYVVRKHLEIPAAGSVLVSPPSDALTDFGFVDMENCILGAPGQELYAKMLAVAGDPARYERIRKAGHDLVHAKYTRQAWTWIPEWFACRAALKPGEMVQQQGVFGTFRAAPKGSPSIADFTVQDNPMGVRLRAAREALLGDGDLQAAAEGLGQAMQWIGHVAEPWFMMGVLAFTLGDRDSAAEWLSQRAAVQGQADPALGLLDPVEIAWLMLFGYLTADEDLFAQMADAAAETAHVAIRRVEWLVDGAKPVADMAAAGLDGPRDGDRLSIHWLGDEPFDGWFGLIQKVLAANFKAAA